SRSTAILGGSDLRSPRNTAFQAVPLHPQQLAQRLRATLLFYWLGEKQSYLWAVTPTKTECFQLPPPPAIATLVKIYRDTTSPPPTQVPPPSRPPPLPPAKGSTPRSSNRLSAQENLL